MTIIRLASAVGVLAVTAAGVLVFAGPASATDGHYPEAGWQVQDTTIGADVDWSDCNPGPVRTDAALSAIVSAEVVGLTGTGVAAPPHYGTSIETTNVGLPVSAGDTVTVDFVLLDGASAAGGAVRLFIYADPGSDTDCTAPAEFVAAPDDGSTSGAMSITVGYDSVIGTLGMVYDSSNGGAGGTVRFSDLKVGDTPVLFTAPAPGPTEGPEPTAEPSERPTPGVGGDAEEQLPTTGAGWVGPAVAVGGAFAVAGSALVWLARHQRRRQIQHAAAE